MASSNNNDAKSPTQDAPGESSSSITGVPNTAATAVAATSAEAERQPVGFFALLEKRCDEIQSLVCVGLDPHGKDLFPEGNFWTVTEEERCDAAYSFCKSLIDMTLPYAAAYKPNMAFFECLGPQQGLQTLRRVVQAIPANIPVIIDAKRGDIGSTATAYADAIYEGLRSSGVAVTLSPLMGLDSMEPFVSDKYSHCGAFLLCKTSNPGSDELLSLPLGGSEKECLYERIARLAQAWSHQLSTQSGPSSRFGLVVGATDPLALARVRKAAGPDVWILAPGVGAQGGDLEAACRAGVNDKGKGLLLPVSRGISRAENPALAAQELCLAVQAAAATALPSTHNNASNDKAWPLLKPYQEDFLRLSLQQGVLKFGSFVLKSGRTSPYFFNAGLFSNGRSLLQLGKFFAHAIGGSDKLMEGRVAKFDVIFGPAYKGIPLAALVAASLYDMYGVEIGFAYNRKEAKDHGEGGVLVGASMEAKRILIVDDVITAGTATRESFDLLQKVGATPMGVVIALDRAEKRSLDNDPISAVQAVERDLAIPLVSIVSLPQLQEFLTQTTDDTKVLQQMAEYQATYGV